MKLRKGSGAGAGAAGHAAPATLHMGDFTTGPRVLVLAAMAVVVASASVAAAWVLLKLIWLVTAICFFGRLTTTPPPFALSPLGPWMIVIPALGGIIIGLMARYGSEKIRGHGIPEAMEAILIGQSRMSPKVAILKPLSSAISIGSGGPFGAEGPIIMTGGAIGSLVAQLFPVTAQERKAMLVAGAAAGMTAVFGTPVASALLAVELLLFEWKPRSFIPVLTAVAVAAAERPLLIGSGHLFAYAGTMALTPIGFLGWIGIGLLGGLGSGLLTMLVYACEDNFTKLPIHWMWWPAIGGIVVGVGGYIDPEALGVGYNIIAHLLTGDWHGGTVALLMVVKCVIWAVALGSGTSGGVLAPLLIMGGALGALVGPVFPAASPGYWALLGMAAIMGGTMRAPLTAAIFALEVTGDMNALLPLITACGTAYAVTVLVMKRSILTEKVARRGTHVLREYQVDPFDLTPVADVMVSPPDTLPASMTLAEAVAFFSEPEPHHKSYPVADDANRLVGMVSRADMLRLARKGAAEGTLRDLVAGREAVVASPTEMLSPVIDRMIASDIGRIPVVEGDGRLVGLVARKDLLKVRARMLAEENTRVAVLRLRRDGEAVNRGETGGSTLERRKPAE